MYSFVTATQLYDITTFPYTTLFRSTSQQRFDATLTRLYQPLWGAAVRVSSEEHTFELRSHSGVVCRLVAAETMQRSLFVFWSVTVPEVVTVSVAAVVVADPAELVNTARYLFPFCDKVVVKLMVVEVAPEMLLKVTPPSVLTCHCTVGVGEPVAAAVKVAV